MEDSQKEKEVMKVELVFPIEHTEDTEKILRDIRQTMRLELGKQIHQ